MLLAPATPEGRLICQAAAGVRSESDRDQLRAIHAALGDERCREISIQNACESLVGCALAAAGCVLSPDWMETLDRNQERVRKMTDALLEVVETFEQLDFRPVLIEGGATLFNSDVPPAAYGSKDFDVLIRPPEWPLVHKVMRDHGFDAAARRARPTKRVEFRHRDHDPPTWLEIGDNPFDRMWMPLRVLDRSAEWISRRVPSKKNPQVHVLSASDSLALAALHASLHSFVRSPGVRLYVDIDRAVRAADMDWSAFETEIELMRAPTRAYVALRSAHDLLGTPLSRQCLDRLRPSEFKERFINRLLRKETIINNGTPKLTRGRALLLDAAIFDGPVTSWLRDLVFPPTSWIREHFDREHHGKSATTLHFRRLISALSRWRPE